LGAAQQQARRGRSLAVSTEQANQELGLGLHFFFEERFAFFSHCTHQLMPDLLFRVVC